MTPIRLYHATHDLFATDIVDRGIDLQACLRDTDFSRGFYTTPNRDQATAWAITRAEDEFYSRVIPSFEVLNRLGLTPSDYKAMSKKPALVSFQVDLDDITALKGKTFGLADDCWKKFVYLCRGSQMLCHEYDYVIGPVADGGLKRGPKGIKSYPVSYKQFSFHTPVAITLLTRRGCRYEDP